MVGAGGRADPLGEDWLQGIGPDLVALYREVQAIFGLPASYKRLEAEFIAPRLLRRRASLSLLGGWREATQVGYYGLGTANSKDDRANYGFKQPYGAATLSMRPIKDLFVARGGFEASELEQTPGSGSALDAGVPGDLRCWAMSGRGGADWTVRARQGVPASAPRPSATTKPRNRISCSFRLNPGR